MGSNYRVVVFHRFGVRYPYVLATATKGGFRVFSRVLVEPDEAV